MTVELSVGKVEIIDRLNWGQKEQIQNSMLSGVKVQNLSDKERQALELNADVIMKAKYKTLEICIKKITLTDGKEIPYTQEWMDGLTVEDGDKLFEAINEVTNPKKK
jgi:hypothetical protein